ncbi:MAG: glycosyltransferase [Proteobacteria bacterium]|nr:glycosyltransferase [Pseudomonadota bacterium]
MRPGANPEAKQPPRLPGPPDPGPFGGQHHRATGRWPPLTTPARDRCPELDCVRHLLSSSELDWAAQRAERLGIGADRVLITAGIIAEETYIRALAASLGVGFEALETRQRADCLLPDEELVVQAGSGLLPLVNDTSAGTVIVLAPRGTAARGLIGLIQRDATSRSRFRLTTPQRFNRFLLRVGRDALARHASESLKDHWPALSAFSRRGFSRTSLAMIAAVLLMAAVLSPILSLMIFELMLSAVFLAWLGLRLIGAFVDSPPSAPNPVPPDRDLPIYSVIAAVYREANSVGGLLAAIERLDYPAEKLDVIIATEADDYETRAALAAIRTRFPITIVDVPVGGPRTKPKALNVALPFARGTFTVIYDAEDRPEFDQLRRALGRFLSGGRNLACVQARLCIDNTTDSWLARYFTAEYAGQFDVFLPGLASLHVPLPLGGSSNHFHTATLRKVGGWDPYNVTEDADLGMRLARNGFRAAMIDSTTYEEAPARLGAWLRQRTRWFKGWMQTWLVHMREPRRLWRDLGPAGFVAFNLMVGGTALAALVHPFFVVALTWSIAESGALWIDDRLSLIFLGILYGITAVCGYLTSAYLGWLGLARRHRSSSDWVLLLTPVHWLLLSTAAWRAVYQLFAQPFLWEKTEHGLARSSHRAARLAQTLAGLEQDLRVAQQVRRTPAIAERARDTSSSRRRPLRASA